MSNEQKGQSDKRDDSLDAERTFGAVDGRSVDDLTTIGPTDQSGGGARYEVIEELGHGGMGVVYKARDTRLNRVVAVKRLLPKLDGSQQAIDRFLNEAQSIAALSHYNIVQIHDIGRDNDGHYIVMEFIEGESLMGRLKREGKLSPEATVKLMVQMCAALEVAHGRGVVHRDIKPHNILLTSKGVPKLADFGLAQMGTEEEFTRTGMMLGTLDYASPEQIKDAKHVDARTDVYSLGATLYHMLAGDNPRYFRERNLPDELREVVMTAMDRDIDRRYQTAAAFREALEGALGSGPSPATASATCPECGLNNPLDAVFCVKCGHDLSDLFGECPTCGRKNRIDVEFCGGCGSNLYNHRRVTKHLENADTAMKQYDFETAIGQFEKVLGIEPEHKNARSQLDEVRQKVGRIHKLRDEAYELAAKSEKEPALRNWQEVLQLHPDHEEARDQAGRLQREMNEEQISAHMAEADRFSAQMQLEEAVAEYEKVLLLDETHAQAREKADACRKKLNTIRELMVSGREYASEQKYEEAIIQWRKALDIHPREKECSELIRDAQNKLDECVGLVKKARMLVEKKQHHEAKEVVDKAILIIPHDTSATELLERTREAISEADALAAQARQLEQTGHPEEAMAAFLEALDVCGDVSEIEEAADNLKLTLEKAREEMVAGDTAMDEKRFARAVQCCRAAREMTNGWEVPAEMEREAVVQQSALDRLLDAAHAAEAGNRLSRAFGFFEKAREFSPPSERAAEGLRRTAARIRPRRLKKVVAAAIIVLVVFGMLGTWGYRRHRLNAAFDELVEKAEIEAGRENWMEAYGHVDDAHAMGLRDVPGKLVQSIQNALQGLAETAKSEAETTRRGASSQDALKFAVIQWKLAEKAITSGESKYGSGDYGEAKRQFDSAENLYAEAKNAARKAKPEMVLIEGGTFRMGSPSSESGHDDDESPVHDVTVSDFYFGKYEVTFAQYDAYCEATSKSKPDDKGWGRGNRPAINVSWNDATAYCEWLSEETGRKYRLPTEAEWEYACRAGTTTARYWGDSDTRMHEYANGADQSAKRTWDPSWSTMPGDDGNAYTSQVGSYKPNPWGLYDMHGNVWEWCADWYDADYYSKSPRIDPQGPSSGEKRVLRGGSWHNSPGNLRSANRLRNTPDLTDYYDGFRVCHSGPAG